ncbi:MAG: BFO_1060 family glycosyltransferase [Bacteroidota bacterium]
MGKSKYKALCFLDDDHGRDVEIMIPLIYFAERELNCEVDFSFIWNIHDIYRKKPDIVLLSNTIGSRLHHKVTKYAHENNIKVFALISEGIFRTNGTFNYYGYNSDRKFYQEYICHWSQRTKIFFDKELPELGSRNVTTGAVGFDRYTIYDFISKEEYLRKKGLQKFKKVIGYAGWAFGKIYNAQGREELKVINKDVNARIRWMEDQMLKVEAILRAAIEANPDVLFILKRHPNEANPTITKENPNEMIRLRDLPNVLYITANENLHDLISISDLWVGFETTTAIEAWLMGKQSVFINPDPDFNRTNIYKGNPVLRTPEQFVNAITEFYAKGEIPGFYSQEHINNREQIYRETIGFADGMNHIRAGYYLMKVLEQITPNEGEQKNVRFSFKYWFMYFLLTTGRFFYVRKLFLRLPRFKKTVWMFEKWHLENVRRLQSYYKKYLDRFYSKENISGRIKREEFWEGLMKG